MQGLSESITFGVPLAPGFIQEADFNGRTTIMMQVTVAATSRTQEPVTGTVVMGVLLHNEVCVRYRKNAKRVEIATADSARRGPSPTTARPK